MATMNNYVTKNFIDIEFEFDELIYDTTEGGVAMVMVCVNLVSGVLALRDVQVDVQPKPFDPALDSADRKLIHDYIASTTII
jgi:hypothetical protein